jgi:hypothetical protein
LSAYPGLSLRRAVHASRRGVRRGRRRRLSWEPRLPRALCLHGGRLRGKADLSGRIDCRLPEDLRLQVARLRATRTAGARSTATPTAFAASTRRAASASRRPTPIARPRLPARCRSDATPSPTSAAASASATDSPDVSQARRGIEERALHRKPAGLDGGGWTCMALYGAACERQWKRGFQKLFFGGGSLVAALKTPDTSPFTPTRGSRGFPPRAGFHPPTNPEITRRNGAERAGFEPAVSLHPHLISNQAPSATRSPLHRRTWQRTWAGSRL